MPGRVFSGQSPPGLALLLGAILLPWVPVIATSSDAGAARVLAAHASTPRCMTSQLVIWLSSTGAAAGTFYYNLEFTNLAGHACSIDGTPKVSAVDLSGKTVGLAGTPSLNEHSPKPVDVVVANDASGYSLLSVADARNYPNSLCHLVIAAGLRVTPPGQGASKVVPIALPECTLTKPQILTTEPVERSPYTG